MSQNVYIHVRTGDTWNNQTVVMEDLPEVGDSIVAEINGPWLLVKHRTFMPRNTNRPIELWVQELSPKQFFSQF